MSDDNLMTIDEVAESLRCSVKHIRNLIKRGRLCGYKNGKAYLFSDERHIQPYLTSIETRFPSII